MDMTPGTCAHHAETSPTNTFRLRLMVFLVVALLVGSVSVWLALPYRSTLHGAHQTVAISMNGFSPDTIHIPAGQEVTLRIDNPDSKFHADGAGMHQFAVDDLGIDVRIDANSSELVTIPALVPGSYTFYCDVCCGGKASPSMLGTLVVG